MKNKNQKIPSNLKLVKGIHLIKEIENTPEPDYIWKGIPEGSKGMIVGVAKTGKTTFAENLAISAAVGRKSFFGSNMDGKPKKVLFINLEESIRLRSRRNAKQIKRLSEEEFELFSENYYSTPGNFPEFLNSDEDWEKVSKYIEAVNPDLLFIDSISRMCVGEIERSVVAQNFVQKFNTYIMKFDITTIVIHHNTKGNDNPTSQDNIAGSRFILQEFEFAYGLANVPTERGGNYGCMLYNKHIAKDDTTAELYSLDESGWITKLDECNKFSLYKPSQKTDGRFDDSNPKIIYDYILNQDSQGNQTVSTYDMKNEFVYSEDNTMSLDTFHRSVRRLLEEEKIQKITKGIYSLKSNSTGKIAE
jgi:KaiC/GvpD/RAD55 family RecA-like ATPase